ncbi:MAG TPA: uroporphyrinogen-III C-methyltransferase [Acetobacteraceae bacterium]|nr:uroporphyrinogen-III C-methyltransferase [Acetobacteraceae bacterium]
MRLQPALIRELEALPALEPGHVWLVGAGPGNPAHLSLLALAALGQADAVLHDALVDPAILALARSGAERIAIGKRGGKPSTAQADIIAQMIALAHAGKRVLRLKGGDPFIFGRGGEEALALAANKVPFRIVPGLTSGLAASATALIPLTLRGINQVVVLATGHGTDRAEGVDWRTLARLGQPIVLYMAMGNLKMITEALIEGGMPAGTPAAALASATLRDERTVLATLGTLVEAAQRSRIEAPAVIVIGKVVETRTKLLALLPALEKNSS